MRLLTTSLGLLAVVGRDTSLNEPSSSIYAPFKRCLLIRNVNMPDIPSGGIFDAEPAYRACVDQTDEPFTEPLDTWET